MTKDIDLLPIGAFAKICKVTVKALHYYEKIGLIKPEYSDPITNYRYYPHSLIEKVLAIKELQKIGFKLNFIKKIIEDETQKELLTLIKSQYNEINQSINELRQKLMKMTQFEQYYNEVLSLKPVTEDNCFYRYEKKRELLYIRKQCEYIGFNFNKYFDMLLKISSSKEIKVKSKMMALFFNKGEIAFSYELETAQLLENIDNVYTVESGYFACTLHTGGYDNISESYKKLYKWIENNSYEICGIPIEIYHITRPISFIKKEYLTEIQIPVKKLKLV